MKRIDRYVLVGFLVRFCGVLVVVFGLYAVFDVLKRTDHVREVGVARALPMLLAYYFYLIPTLSLDTVPVLILLSAGLMLVRMSRAGELLTLKASGVDVRRVAVPILVFTLPAVILIAWARERIVPEFTRRHQVLELKLEGKMVSGSQLRDEPYGRLYWVQTYDYRKSTFSRVSVFEFTQPGSDADGANFLKSITMADSAAWTSDGKIMLETATIQGYDANGLPEGRPVIRDTKLLETSLAPYDFVRANADAINSRMPALTVAQLSRQSRRYPEVKQFAVMLQSRLAAPMVPFALLLIGIPLLVGFETSVRSRMLGLCLCMLVAAGFHVISFVLVSMANTGVIAPFFAAWLPVASTGGAGAWLFATMRT